MKLNIRNLFNHTSTISFVSKFLILFFNFFTSFVVLFNLSDLEQALYFTITSLFFIQTFVELGFNSVLLHFVANARKNLFLGKSMTLEFNNESNHELFSLAKFSKLWIICSSLILFIILLISGLFVFSDLEDYKINNLWIYISIFFSLSFILQPIYIFFDAIGMLRSVCYLRLIQNISLNICFCYFIFSNFGLESFLFAQIIAFSLIFLILLLKYKNLIMYLFFNNLKGCKFNWKDKFFPMQWRIGISSICGYLLFFSYTPLVFKYIDPILAGKVGFMFSILAGYRGLISSILNPYVSKYAFLISRNKSTMVNKYIRRNTILIFYLSIVFILFYYLITYILKILYFSTYERLLDPKLTLILFLGNFLICLSLPISSYLRSFRVEPLMKLSIISACMAILGNIFACYYKSIDLMVYFFLLTNIAVVPFIYFKYKNKAN